MKFTPLEIPEVLLIEPDVHGDGRGFFSEWYREDVFREHGIGVKFVQDNHSRSSRGVLRGLHYQIPPHAQDKLVRVIRGSAFDAACDIRKGSKTFGRHVSALLSDENRRMLYIPKGFAHGFLALEEGTEFLYKVSDFYSPEHERGILWSDPAMRIDWPKLDMKYLLSEKDQKFPTLPNAVL